MRVAKFEAISAEQFKEDFTKGIYDDIKLPTRATSGSAGYDFYAPYDFIIYPDESIIIPTGIRVKIDPDWVLLLMPKSGLGFKYNLHLSNTLGVIDSDYYYSDNEGHIKAKLINGSDRPLEIKKGQGFMQGIFIPYGITEDDDADGIRNGGFGSTEKIR